jgi:hypothetical protein
MASTYAHMNRDGKAVSYSVISTTISDDIYGLTITSKSDDMNVFLNQEQLVALSEYLSSYVKQFARIECEACGGSGTEVIAHGDTSFSGDDDCLFCQGQGMVNA